MKKYNMKLLPQYFDYIKFGTKRIELRLNDKKRNGLEVGDLIIFEKIDEEEYLNTKVKKIYKYDNFNELVDNFEIDVLADKSINKEELLKTLNNIYTKEQQDTYGVLGIEIELV